MKKLFFAFTIILIMFSAVFTAGSEEVKYFYDNEWHEYVGNTMSLKINGEEVKGEMPPIIFSDRSVVPAREVFEELGAVVVWNAENETVSVNYEGTSVRLIINSRIAKVNSVDVTMEIPAKLINGKTMIPARFVGEKLGMEVDFDSKTDTIIINNIPNETEEPTPPEKQEPLETEPPQATDEPIEMAEVKFLDFEIDEEDKVLKLTLETDEKLKFSHFVLEKPDRIVIDCINGLFSKIPEELVIEKGNVDKIRFGNQTASARIVVDISENIGYNVDSSDDEIVITIKMTSTEERKVDMLSSAVYRKQGTIDYFESPYNIINVSLSAEKKTLLVTVDTENKRGEDASKSVNTLYANAIGFTQKEEGIGEYTISLKTSKVRFNVAGEKMVYVKPEIEPLAKSVMLDAGHGGNDPGAVYIDEDGNVLVKEKDLNLSVTLMVKELLEDEGVEVNLIREEDIYVDYLKVGSIANSVGSTLFVSIHTNSFTNTEVHGIEVYGYLTGGTVSNGMSSEQLSKNLLNGLLEETDAADRGVRDGKNLAVINSTKVPAALVEIGFITNEAEREKMVTKEYQQKLARGIANGILKSFEEMEIE